MRILEDKATRYFMLSLVLGVFCGWLASALNQLRPVDVSWSADVFYGIRTGAVVAIAWSLEKAQPRRKWIALLVGYMICADNNPQSQNILWAVLSSIPTGIFGIGVAGASWIGAETCY